jgi:hypothetical protein
MRIDTAALALHTARHATQQREVQEHLRVWSGPRPTSPAVADHVSISEAARSKAADEADATTAQDSDALEHDPKLQLIIDMVERLTGHRVRLVRARDLQVTPEPVALEDPHRPAPAPAPSAGFGLEYDYHATYTETESTQFAAEGVIRTTDGRDIRFQLTLTMQRSYHEESSVSLRLGDAARPTKDPLVINFAGTAAQLAETRFAFDLDADGVKEQINQLGTGSGFLALDLNQNGRVDDGRELFGARSGDGFAELARHDADGNGWIDENDPIYAQLQVWRQAADGAGTLSPLAASGVGAVSLARVATPFDLKTPANTFLGNVRASGIYLREDGQAGTVQQLDLSV